MKPGQVGPWSGYQRRQAPHEFHWAEHDLPAAVLQQPWMLASFAEESDYLILSSRRAMQPWLKSNALTIIEVSDLQMGIDIELVKRDTPDSSPAVELLAETIRQVVSHQYPDT
jgi:DNA-binding transcriptional LysR family regulator